MKYSNWMTAGLLACGLALGGCGGGGGSAGTSPFSGGGGSAVTAADLDVTTSSAQLPNTPTSKVTVTVTALDGGKRTVAGVPVTISVASGSDAVVTQTTAEGSTASATNSSGVATADVTVGANKANRSVTVLATSGSITKSVVIQVVGATISSTVSAPVVDPGAKGSVRYRVVDQAKNPMPGQSVQVSAVGLIGVNPTGTTDLNGEYVFSYTAPTATGSYSITASAAGVSNDQTILVQPASSVPVAVGTITSASVSASPSVVPINATGTQNRTEIRALFLGSNNAPIANVRARFDLNGDVNSIGGSFTSGSAVIYSDVNGFATSAYVTGPRPSPTNGVTIRVCYAKTDPELANGACPNAAFVTLTVVNDPLGVSIGTDEFVIEGTLTYIKQYVVSVVDAAGNAKPDVNLSVSVDLPTYYKGDYCVVGTVNCISSSSGLSGWVRRVRPPIACNNEDLNRNGVLERGEDLDLDSRLEPGKSDVSVRLLSTKTGANGLALLQIEYPRNYATWVAARVTVNASGVSGTEGRATYVQDPVPAPAAAFITTSSSPAFVISPYGVVQDCSDPR